MNDIVGNKIEQQKQRAFTYLQRARTQDSCNPTKHAPVEILRQTTRKLADSSTSRAVPFATCVCVPAVRRALGARKEEADD